jgi:hypothetical protein
MHRIMVRYNDTRLRKAAHALTTAENFGNILLASDFCAGRTPHRIE